MTAEQVMGEVSELPGMPRKPDTPYADAHAEVTNALDRTKRRLQALRDQRATINAEIRELVEQEELLTRMSRVTPKKAS